MNFRLRGGVEVEIRPIVPRDLSGVLTLERALTTDGTGMVRGTEDLPRDENELRRELAGWFPASERGLYLVAAATTGGTVPVLGSGEIRRLTPARVQHVGVVALAVHPTVRREGLGRALLEGLLTWADRRLHRTELSVRADNPQAIALYRNLGFEEEGRRKAFVRIDEDTYVDDVMMGRLRP